MENYYQISAAILICALITVILSKGSKEFSLLFVITVCVVVTLCTLNYIQPLINFLYRLAEAGNISKDYLAILLKITGMSLLYQICGTICLDSGNRSLEKVLQIFTTTSILWLAIPLLEDMLSLITSVLEAV